LEKANEEGQEARVMTVLAAGHGKPLEAEDLGLKKNYTLVASARQPPTYNDLIVEEYAIRHPKMSFIHITPGWVSTNIGRDMHWSLKPVLSAISVFSKSINDCGEYMLSALVSPQYKHGAFHLTDHGEPVPATETYVSDDAREKLVRHYTKEVAVA